MKDIRLVALDLDGTVFNDKKRSPRARWRLSAQPVHAAWRCCPPPGVQPAASPRRSRPSPACGTR
ncbi:hypothetical protein NIA69_09695 [Gemmiger formicilis]|nr:hypothetical protein [Gemmiger formicilis]